jgi:hypothetical protein
MARSQFLGTQTLYPIPGFLSERCVVCCCLRMAARPALANDEHALTKEDSVSRQQEHFSRAAQLYETYAMYACNTKFDAKVSFGPHGEYGERVGMRSGHCVGVSFSLECLAGQISSIRCGVLLQANEGHL